MTQMINRQASFVCKLPLSEIRSSGFFARHKGRIFAPGLPFGRKPGAYRVKKDGTISRQRDGSIRSGTVVEVVTRQALGISEKRASNGHIIN
jgi:hypothetical protein